MEKTVGFEGLQPIQRPRTLPDDVYDVLLKMLIWGTWEPDTSLSIDRLSQMLAVSPTPVREALARLEGTGLVRRTARRGYRVSPPMSKDQMSELVDARLVLETGAIERAMRNLDKLLPDLEEAFARHESSMMALLSGDSQSEHDRLRQYFDDDWSFHQAILRHCGNRYLEQAVNALSFRVHRMRQSIGVGRTDAPIAVGEHKTILEAVRLGDTAGARDALHTHLDKLLTRVDSDAQN